jgi:hypothetical protein
MVDEKRCNPPKKNSKLLQKIVNQQSEFLEPLPPKKTWRDDDERRILGEVQNTMEYEPSFNMSKEFSFGPMVSSQVSKAKKKAI